MYYEDNRVKDLKVAYIGGGSRGWAWGFMMDLAADAQMEGTVALYDIDHEAAEHNEIIGNKISAHPDAVSHWKYTVADTLLQALTGADEELGLKDVARQDIKVNVKGINHFTWFDKATYKGMDLFPIYRKIAEEHYESGYEYGDTNWMNSSFACANRVKFDLFLRYGCIAAAGDRHLAEFMPGKTYLESPEAVREWKFGLTTVAWRKNELQERLARSRRLRTGEEPIEIKPDGEEGHLLMKALLGLGDLVSNVNIPNHGAIANLPWDAVVEVNALFSRQGVQSVNAGPLPANILPLVARHVYNQENTLTAALTCDRTLGLTTFMNDPQVTLNWKQGKELFDTMLHNTCAYLPKEWNA